jgi:p-cumate 2,3-dioxygenase ferredoxin subunit
VISVCKVDALRDGEHQQRVISGVGVVCVYRVAGQFYVTSDSCTHLQASLGEEGSLEGYVIQCSWHNGKFDIRTGEVLAPPCVAPLRVYPVQVRNGEVCIVV